VARLGEAAASGEVVVATEFSQALALDVVLETVFGDSQALDRPAARAVLRNMVHAFHPSILAGRIFQKSWFPPWRRLVQARAAFDVWANDVIRTRRGRGEDALGADVLGVILAARYEDGSPMTDSEVRDQLITLLLAGHETSATALAWCIYYLARTPEVLGRLRSELDALVMGRAAESSQGDREIGSRASFCCSRGATPFEDCPVSPKAARVSNPQIHARRTPDFPISL
jgi:cytochrome P450